MATAMEITPWRPPRTLDEHAAWTIRLGDLQALLNRMPELSPDLRAAIIAQLLQRIREKSR